MTEAQTLHLWARDAIEKQILIAADALACHCKKPRSMKRLHAARKALARLRSALEDLGALAGVAPEFHERVRQLHRLAGKLRDADVLIERIAAYREDAVQTESDQLTEVRFAVRKRRKRARRKLHCLLRKLPELRT